MPNLSDAINAITAAEGKKQIEIATAAGYGKKSYYTILERGITKISVLQKIAEYLDYDIDIVFTSRHNDNRVTARLERIEKEDNN